MDLENKTENCETPRRTGQGLTIAISIAVPLLTVAGTYYFAKRHDPRAATIAGAGLLATAGFATKLYSLREDYRV